MVVPASFCLRCFYIDGMHLGKITEFFTRKLIRKNVINILKTDKNVINEKISKFGMVCKCKTDRTVFYHRFLDQIFFRRCIAKSILNGDSSTRHKSFGDIVSFEVFCDYFHQQKIKFPSLRIQEEKLHLNSHKGWLLEKPAGCW